MADTVTSVDKLNGWFKHKYGQFQDNIPDVAKFEKMIGEIVKAQQIGRQFNFPVELSLPQGVTYAVAGAGAFDFAETVPGEMKEAQIDGSQILASDIIDYESAAKATAEGAEAYGNAAERLTARLRKAGHKRVEMAMWYGQSATGLGVVNSASTVGGKRSCIIKSSDWAVGVWTGMKNMRVDVYSSSGVAQANKRTTTTYLSVDSVDVKNKTIVLAGTDFASVAANDIIVPYGVNSSADVKQEMKGIDAIVTASSSIFNIDPSSYELWKGNSFDNGSVAFSLKKLNDAIADAVGKGLEEKATVFVSPRTWANLCSDQAALRKYDASYSQNAKFGFRSLTMFSQNGELEIVPHTIVKEGEAWILPTERFMKIGAQDLGFNIPGRGEQYFEQVPGKAGYRIMCYAHLAIICGAPGMCTKVTNITNS